MVHREKRFDITARRFERSWTSTFDLVRFTPRIILFIPSPQLSLSFPRLSIYFRFFSHEFSMPTMTLEFTRWILLLMGPRETGGGGGTKCGERNGSSIIRRMSNWNILMNVCISNNGTGQNTRQKRGEIESWEWINALGTLGGSRWRHVSPTRFAFFN